MRTGSPPELFGEDSMALVSTIVLFEEKSIYCRNSVTQIIRAKYIYIDQDFLTWLEWMDSNHVSGLQHYG